MYYAIVVNSTNTNAMYYQILIEGVFKDYVVYSHMLYVLAALFSVENINLKCVLLNSLKHFKLGIFLTLSHRMGYNQILIYFLKKMVRTKEYDDQRPILNIFVNIFFFCITNILFHSIFLQLFKMYNSYFFFQSFLKILNPNLLPYFFFFCYSRWH